MSVPSKDAVVSSVGPQKAPETVVSLYEIRKKVYPRAVHGWFAGWRWALVWLTQAVFYLGPWLRWNDRPAILFDLAERKFYLLGLVLWPQDFIYLTALLVISALSLFLFTAVAGRLFCGYACPQTVYTEIFMWVERRIEGDRLARMRLDQAGWTASKIIRKTLKQIIWLLISLWTGFTFAAYFTPITQQVQEVWQGGLGGWQTFWILFYGFATYGNAGYMREQVCKYMCPYARFQSSMFDRDTMIITYDQQRGEPRGSRRKKVDPREAGLGDCVDCGICVQVCPTGIDIRQGLQYECIGCAACIDACDQVMDKMGYAPGLIRYTTENALQERWSRRQIYQRLLRPRVLIYMGILGAVASGLATALIMRNPLKADVIRDRGVLARELEEGRVENIYRIQLINTEEVPRRYRIEAQWAEKTDQTDELIVASENEIAMPATTTRMIPVRVQMMAKSDSNSLEREEHYADHDRTGKRIRFTITALDNPKINVQEPSIFYVPH